MTTPLPSPPRRWPWLRLAGLVLLALVVTSFWKMALRYQAASELRAAGFWPGSWEVWPTVHNDWRLLFRRRTWHVEHRVETWEPAKAARIRNLDALVPSLQRLEIEDIRMEFCPELRNVEALKDLPSLKSLMLDHCTALKNVDGLKGLPYLTSIQLTGCTALQNVDSMKDLTALRYLGLFGCTGLENVDALHRLTALKGINLYGCTKLSPESLAALHAALPNTEINDPGPARIAPSPPSPEGN